MMKFMNVSPEVLFSDAAQLRDMMVEGSRGAGRPSTRTGLRVATRGLGTRAHRLSLRRSNATDTGTCLNYMPAQAVIAVTIHFPWSLHMKTALLIGITLL